MGVREARAVISSAEKRKIEDLSTIVAVLLSEDLPKQSIVGWKLVSLAFDSLVSPFATTSKVINEYTATVAKGK